jgi:hypothetical protein
VGAAAHGEEKDRCGGGAPQAARTQEQVGPRRTSLQTVHGQRVAAGREDLTHFADLWVVRPVQLLAHKEALLQMLERLKGLALLLHRGVHLVMLPKPPLHVVDLIRREPRPVRHRSPALITPLQLTREYS